jgi:hypothetical protein
LLVRRWLVVEIDETERRAVLHDTPHRLPRSFVVSLGLAARLSAVGVPMVVKDLRGRNRVQAS